MNKYIGIKLLLKKIENIEKSLSESLDISSDGYEELETLEDVKEYHLDFMVEVREQLNLLTLSVHDLHKFNHKFILNKDKKQDKKIDTQSKELKKEILRYRY